jgi:hypothetical protein
MRAMETDGFLKQSKKRSENLNRRNKMKAILSRVLLVAMVLVAGFGFAGCASDVEGNTYVDAEGVISIEFLSGGKANFKMGVVGGACTYTESGKNVAVTCNGVPQVFTMNSDGSLGGPAAGLIGKLTKKTK